MKRKEITPNDKSLKNKKARYHQDLNLKDINWQKLEKIFEPEKESIIEILVKEVDRYPHAKEILYLLAAGAVFAGSIAFPCLPVVLSPLVRGKGGYRKSRFTQTVKRLKRQKLVEITEEKGKQVVKITEKGRIRALRYKLDEMEIKKPDRWDGRWRIIIFDIPEKNRAFRDVFRAYIKKLGLYQLQQSVYVYPYPCFDEIEFLRQIFYVSINVRYILAERIENESDLRRYFRL